MGKKLIIQGANFAVNKIDWTSNPSSGSGDSGSGSGSGSDTPVIPVTPGEFRSSSSTLTSGYTEILQGFDPNNYDQWTMFIDLKARFQAPADDLRQDKSRPFILLEMLFSTLTGGQGYELQYQVQSTVISGYPNLGLQSDRSDVVLLSYYGSSSLNNAANVIKIDNIPVNNIPYISNIKCVLRREGNQVKVFGPNGVTGTLAWRAIGTPGNNSYVHIGGVPSANSNNTKFDSYEVILKTELVSDNEIKTFLGLPTT